MYAVIYLIGEMVLYMGGQFGRVRLDFVCVFEAYTHVNIFDWRNSSIYGCGELGV